VTAGQRTIDIHAHILSEETIGLIAREAPVVAPKLTRLDAESAMLEIAGTPYRPFPRGGFDLERRFSDMAAAGVDTQAISVTPQSFLYGQDPPVTVTCARLQNEQIARTVAAHLGRFLGLATLR
jgi:aminocarboxymuconate-semialdehyde decarboxylase